MTDDLERRLADCEDALIATERERDEAKLADAMARAERIEKLLAQTLARLSKAYLDVARLAAALRRCTDVTDTCVRWSDGVRTCENTGSDPCRPCQARQALAAAPQATAMVEAIRAVLQAAKTVCVQSRGQRMYEAWFDPHLPVKMALEEALAHPALKEWVL